MFRTSGPHPQSDGRHLAHSVPPEWPAGRRSSLVTFTLAELAASHGPGPCRDDHSRAAERFTARTRTHVRPSRRGMVRAISELQARPHGWRAPERSIGAENARFTRSGPGSTDGYGRSRLYSP